MKPSKLGSNPSSVIMNFIVTFDKLPKIQVLVSIKLREGLPWWHSG